MFRYLSFLLCGFILLQRGETTHFRGGYLSWKPTGRPNEIELFFRLAHRLQFFSESDEDEGGDDCTDQLVRDNTPVRTGAKFDVIEYFDKKGETRSNSTLLFDGKAPLYTCTYIRDEGDNELLHWSTGYNSTVVTLPNETDTKIWTVGYDSCCWVRSLENYGPRRSWRLRTLVNLNPRDDLGDGEELNSSPYVEGLPLKIVRQECITFIAINAIDPNGDKIRCRWTSEEKGECESPNCGNPDTDIFDMRRNTCMIEVDAPNAEEGLYAVAVIVEDFKPGSGRRSKPLSKISYQFLVLIQKQNKSCDDSPKTLPTEKACYAVPLVITPPFKMQLRAKASNATIPIQGIDLVSPGRMTKSDLIQDGNGLAHVEVTWTPTADLNGTTTQLCYQAVDEQSFAGEELCVQLYVGGEVPKPIPESSIPNSDTSTRVHFNNKEWKVYFSTAVQLSNEMHNASVRFLYKNGTEAYALNLTTANEVNISTSAPYYIEFETADFKLSHNTTYTIKFEEGAVVGTKGCNLLSEMTEWSFTTDFPRAGVTNLEYLPPPPVVSVVCRPTFMVAYIEKQSLPVLDPSLLTYEDPECYGTDHNTTHFAVGTMYGKCGTYAVVNEEKTRVSMVNVLYIPKEGNFIYGGVVTRTSNFEVHVNCSIPTKRVAYVEFNTNSTTELYQTDSVGDFDYALKMFRDSSYSHGAYRIWDFPIDVEEGSRIYFEARTYNGMSPFLEECVASPTVDPEGTMTYLLYRNGCPMDETIEEYRKGTSRLRFSMEAFSFIGYNLQSSIFVHCKIRDCNLLNGSCDANCTEPESLPHANIAKRSVTSRVVNSDPQTDGPIRILEKKKPCSEDQQRRFSYGEVILIVLVSVALAVTLVLTLLVVKGQMQQGKLECALREENIFQSGPAVIKLPQ